MHRGSNTFKITALLLFCSLFSFGQQKHKLIESVSLNTGFTLFKNQYRNNNLNNHYSYFAKAFNLGIEIYNKPWNISVEMRKTYWLGVSASSYSTDVGATASYNQIGIIKYIDLRNSKRKIGINLSHLWVAEYETFFGLGNSSSKGYFQVDTYWTSKSISLSGSINITKKLFTELRVNYYYYVGNYYNINSLSIPKKGINDNRVQLSIIYKLNKELN